MTTSNIQASTPVCIVETNPHRQTSSVWIGATTVGDVIRVLQQKTAFSSVQPDQFLRDNAKVDLSLFKDSNGEFDNEGYNAWEDAQPIEAHFEAAIDCARDDGHIIKVYWSKDDALNDGAPRYMSDEDYAKSVDLVF